MENNSVYEAMRGLIDSGASPEGALIKLRGNPLYAPNLSLTTPEEDRRLLEFGVDYAKGK